MGYYQPASFSVCVNMFKITLSIKKDGAIMLQNSLWVLLFSLVILCLPLLLFIVRFLIPLGAISVMIMFILSCGNSKFKQLIEHGN